MTQLLDGPAAGKVLMLKRAPLFLRVVISDKSEIDALDQLTDEPLANERIYAYKLAGDVTRVHVNRGRNGCGWYVGGPYRLVLEQPDDATMRDRARWREWTAARAAEGKA